MIVDVLVSQASLDLLVRRAAWEYLGFEAKRETQAWPDALGNAVWMEDLVSRGKLGSQASQVSLLPLCFTSPLPQAN